MTDIQFDNRVDAGQRLGTLLKRIRMQHPLVLAIPRGGVEVAAPIAEALGAEMDVLLCRKLCAPDQHELAVGSVNESGDVQLNRNGRALTESSATWLERERARQMTEIARQQRLFRALRPKAHMKQRTLVVVDDGVATGATLMAALQMLHDANPHEVIVAVPVASRESIPGIRALCDQFVCLHEPEEFWAVGQFYRDFPQLSDERAVALLRQHSPNDRRRAESRAHSSMTSN